MTNRPDRDWRVVVLAVVSGACGLLSIALGASSSAYALIGPLVGGPGIDAASQMAALILAGALAFIGSLALISSYYAWRRIRRGPEGPFRPGPIRLSRALILMLVWLASSMLGQAVLDQAQWRWMAPVLQVIAVGTPVYVLVRCAIAALDGGSRLRLWGTLICGVLLGTGLAAAAEILLLIGGIGAATAYLLLHPDQLLVLQNVVLRLGQGPSMQEALTLLGPWLASPVSMMVILAAVSGAIPVVEELAKSATPWMIYSRLATATQGFWCGTISGAGFALFEGLTASADASENWGFILLIRGASSSMHILASALAGWGIGSFHQSRKAGRLVTGYGLAIAIHAIWNASVVAIGYGGLRSALSGGTLDAMALLSTTGGALSLMVLLVLLPAAILASNWRLRRAAASNLGARANALQRASLVQTRH